MSFDKIFDLTASWSLFCFLYYTSPKIGIPSPSRWRVSCGGGGNTTNLFRDGAPFLLLIETSPMFGRSYASSICPIKTVCLLVQSPSCSPSVAAIYLLGQRSFSRYSPVYQNLPCHIHSSNFLISSNASRFFFVYFTFSYYVSPTLYCCAARAHIYYKKIKYTPAVRSNILSKLTFASCV